jgi:hypothetical protein
MERQNMLGYPLRLTQKKTEKDFIPFLGGRPDRTTVISLDDITDLVITLNVTNSVEEFLSIIK